MKFTATSVVFSALAAMAAAAAENPFVVPTAGFTPVAGKDVQLTWNPTAGKTVTLVLRSGASNNLEEGTAIAEKIQNTGSYTWAVDKDTVRGSDYTIEIINDDDPTETNYFPYFVIDSTVTVASTSMSTYTYGAASTSPAATTAKSAASATATSSGKSTMETSTKSGSSSSASGSASSSGASSTGASSTASSTASRTASSSGSSATETSAGSGNAPTSGAARVVAGGLAGLVAAFAVFVL